MSSKMLIVVYSLYKYVSQPNISINETKTETNDKQSAVPLKFRDLSQKKFGFVYTVRQLFIFWKLCRGVLVACAAVERWLLWLLWTG